MSLECVRKDRRSVLPQKAGGGEVGYDIYMIEKVKELDADTVMYDTGIVVKPPAGYFVEIVARSSIVKTGWMLANGIGVIDPTYRDTLKIVLKRVSKDTPEVMLPSRICQLVIRPLLNRFEVKQVDVLEETERTGGFGSTDE